MRTFKLAAVVAGIVFGMLSSSKASATQCPTTWNKLRGELKSAIPGNSALQMWAVVVNRNGVVCAVAFSGATLNSQWLLSRQIAAAKAFTISGLSPQFTETAQLDGAVQPPGASLYGLAAGNPLDPAKIYKGPQGQWGTPQDPMVGEIVGGTITFGGGTAIEKNGKVIGAVGVSGSTAAEDQAVANVVASQLGN